MVGNPIYIPSRWSIYSSEFRNLKIFIKILNGQIMNDLFMAQKVNLYNNGQVLMYLFIAQKIIWCIWHIKMTTIQRRI